MSDFDPGVAKQAADRLDWLYSYQDAEVAMYDVRSDLYGRVNHVDTANDYNSRTFWSTELKPIPVVHQKIASITLGETVSKVDDIEHIWDTLGWTATRIDPWMRVQYKDGTPQFFDSPPLILSNCAAGMPRKRLYHFDGIMRLLQTAYTMQSLQESQTLRSELLGLAAEAACSKRSLRIF